MKLGKRAGAARNARPSEEQALKITKHLFFKLSIVTLAFGTAIGLGVLTSGKPLSTPRLGVVEDWSNHRLVFSNPGTAADALAQGRFEQWYRITSDPRYQLQQLKRSFTQRVLAAAPDFEARTAILNASSENAELVRAMPRPVRDDSVNKDWSTGLGTGVKASASSTFSGEPGYRTTLTISGLGNKLILTALYMTSTSCTFTGGSATVDFTRSATTSTDATNLVSLINTSGCGSTVGVSASSSGATVTITATTAGTAGNSITVVASSATFDLFSTTTTNLSGGTTATVQPNVYPAKYGASITTASCSGDFVVYPTGYVGSATTANIIAYNNLYTTGCAGTVPSVYWAYNTGAYAVTTSPVTSLDGSKVAFTQSNGTAAELVVLKWASSTTETLTSPGTPTTSTNITTCTAPCMTVTALSHNDTYSAPFYDYLSDDALYVGDGSGYLEKFTGVFNGSSVTAVTPVSLGSYAISSPVYDPTSGCVFVGDSEGYLYSVTSGAGGTVCTGSSFALYGHSENLGDGAANEGIFDAPLVDDAAQRVYAFVTDSAAIGSCAAGDNCVAQFTTSTITSGSTTAAPAAAEPLGTGAATYNLYAGTFDNVYYSSSTPTGNLYAIGNTGATTGATLYRIPISSSTMSSPVSAVTGLTSTEYPWPSPLTEFCNNGTSACVSNGTATTSGTDYLFFSVNRGTPTGCTNAAGDGCVLSYNISTTTPALSGSGLNVTTPGTNGCWATGGFVIDNSASGTTGAQQIYFINLDGAAAGSPNGATPASSNCTAGAGPTIDATQASQSNP
jgi:hypothetical protein